MRATAASVVFGLLAIGPLVSAAMADSAKSWPMYDGMTVCIEEADFETFYSEIQARGSMHVPGTWQPKPTPSCKTLWSKGRFTALKTHHAKLERTQIRITAGPDKGVIGWIVGGYLP